MMWNASVKQSTISSIFKTYVKHFSRYVTTVNPEEYTEVPQYPPIEDLSYVARVKRKNLEWHNKIKSIQTVEEKLFELNIKKYYGHRCLVLTENSVPYDGLSFMQYATRTHLKEVEYLPDYYLNVRETPSEVTKSIQSQIEDAIVFETCDVRRKYEVPILEDNYISPDVKEDLLTESLVQQVNNIVLTSLSPTYPHLLQCLVDHKPRVEAYWFLGGIPPPTKIRRHRASVKWLKEINYHLEPVDRFMQYKGSPLLTLRNDLPLPPVVNYNESENPELQVPVFDYDPKTIGFVEIDYRNGTNIPGYWPGDPSEFGQLSFHSRGYMLTRNHRFGEKDNEEALYYQGILASFGWAFSQACYQGFNSVNDITYPLISQAVITNGRLWSFFTYQLNTTLLTGNNARNNPRVNICWATKPLALYESVENGRVIGFNEDVLKILLKFYGNIPHLREDTNMKPFVDPNVNHIADIKDKERREWWEKQFKYMYSNRPRKLLVPEVYDWERIYKIMFQTRPIDKKLRWFEQPSRRDPLRRRFDEHPPCYIPKCKRVGKIRGFGAKKWENTYYN